MLKKSIPNSMFFNEQGSGDKDDDQKKNNLENGFDPFPEIEKTIPLTPEQKIEVQDRPHREVVWQEEPKKAKLEDPFLESEMMDKKVF